MSDLFSILGPFALLVWLFIIVMAILAFLMPLFVYQIHKTVKRQEEIMIKMEDYVKKLYLILGMKK